MSNRCNTSDKIPVIDIVKSLMDREDNASGRGFRRYMAAAKDVYRELNLFTIKSTKRVFISVDKRTNRIIMPSDFIMMSSISVIDQTCGRIEPLITNSVILNDVVDMGLDRSCGCSCGCNGEICGNIYKYESIQREVSAPMPGGGTANFTETTRKRVDKNGCVFQEVCGPVVKYDSVTGQHTSTVMECIESEICKLEVKECGCVVESEKNREVFSSVCCGRDYKSECGPVCCIPNNPYGYNTIDGSSDIAFASDFPFSEVLLRYYADVPVSQLTIPVIAKNAMISGIKAILSPFDKKEPMYKIQFWKNDYEVEKEKLHNIVNRYSLKEFYTTMFNPNRR